MTDHTSEPWLDDKHGEPALYAPGGAVRIATFHRRKRAIADKDRARACVNACVGIPTEQLKSVEALIKEGYEKGYQQAIKNAVNVVALQNGPDRGKLIVDIITKINALLEDPFRKD